MKKRIFSLVFIFSFIFSNTAKAGPRVGNGGSAWLCAIDKETSWIQTLDLYEALHEFHLSPLDYTNEKYDEIIAERIEQLGRIDELENYNFHKYLEEVRTGFILVEMTELIPIDDTDVRVTPGPATCPNGEIRQVQVANILINSNFNDFINLNLINYCKKKSCPDGTEFEFHGVTIEGVEDKVTYKMHQFKFMYGIDAIGKECQFDVIYTALTGRKTGRKEHYISRISFNCY